MKNLLILTLGIALCSHAQTNVRLVKDLNPGPNGGGAYDGINMNGNSYFFADDGVHGVELFKVNQLDEVELLMDINPGSGTSWFPQPDLAIPPVVVSSTVFFQADDGVHGYELWATAGSSTTTHMVKDINPGDNSGLGSGTGMALVQMGGYLYFYAFNGSIGALWRTDGSGAGTTIVKDSIFSIEYLTLSNNMLFFAGMHMSKSMHNLWRSDGTTAGTYTIGDGGNVCCGSYPEFLTDVNGTLYFSGRSGTDGHELWKSDGTKGGTTLVMDIRNGSMGSEPSRLTNVNGNLYFLADDGLSGRELWRRDLTGGIQIVKDILVGPTGSNIDSNSFNRRFTHVNGTLYFSANDGSHGNELWESDGTLFGTKLKEDINPGPASSLPKAFFQQNGKVYFGATDKYWGRELFECYPAASGALMLEDIRSNHIGSYPSQFFNHNGALMFLAEDQYNGGELRVLTVKHTKKWNTLSTGVFNSLRSLIFLPIGPKGTSGAEAGMAVGFDGTIIKTTDHGVTWSSKASNTTAHLFGVHFAGTGTGWAVGSEGSILKTTDAGETWMQQPSGTTLTLRSVFFKDVSNGFVTGSSGTLLKTSNGGTNWSPVTTGVGVVLTSIHFENATTGYISGFNGTLLKTTDGGTNWTPLTSGVTKNLTDVHMLNGKGYACGYQGTLLKTTDGGTNWTSITPLTNYDLNSVMVVDADTAYAMGASGTILKTINGGTNWSVEESPTGQDIYDVTASQNELFAPGGSGKIIKTYQGTLSDIASLSQKNTRVRVVPNPFHETARIEMRSGSGNGSSEFTLYDTSGKTILRHTFEASADMIISRDQLPEGIYFYSVLADGKLDTGKLVIQ